MVPADDGSVTAWLDQLKAGDRAAAAKLWERYFDRLVRLARGRLPGPARRVMDEEDVALSAFDSFCRGGARGQFAQLRDRDDLWQLLVLITLRKAHDALAHQRRQKRGGGRVLDEAALPGLRAEDGGAAAPGLEGFRAREPSPDFAAQVGEQFEHLLERLGDDTLRRLVLLRMEGYTEDEIAARLGTAGRTVRRKLALVRQILKREGESC
jgi:DNA-directed RNA polymerase specialized sigma24 family protein